jgi:hypothetical protein
MTDRYDGFAGRVYRVDQADRLRIFGTIPYGAVSTWVENGIVIAGDDRR